MFGEKAKLPLLRRAQETREQRDAGRRDARAANSRRIVSVMHARIAVDARSTVRRNMPVECGWPPFVFQHRLAFRQPLTYGENRHRCNVAVRRLKQSVMRCERPCVHPVRVAVGRRLKLEVLERSNPLSRLTKTSVPSSCPQRSPSTFLCLSSIRPELTVAVGPFAFPSLREVG